MRRELKRRTSRLEALALGPLDLAHQWLERAQRWSSLVDFARAQALDPDAPDDGSWFADRIRDTDHARRATEGSMGRVVAEALLLRELVIDLDTTVLADAEALRIRLAYLLAVRAGQPDVAPRAGPAWEPLAWAVVGQVAAVGRVIERIERRVERPVLFDDTLSAWTATYDLAQDVATWLPSPTERQRARFRRHGDAAYQELVDRCRASTLDALGYPELARRIRRFSLIGFD